MLNENIKNFRKQKGLSQEELAIRLNIVRQTISKWEKGYSVPDSQMLIKLSDVFEISVSELLGETVQLESNQNEIAQKLEQLNSILATRNNRWRKFWRITGYIVLGIIVFNIIIVIIAQAAYLDLR